MTKSFTALAILQLRDAGKLRLDDSVHTYVPALKDVAYLTQDAPPITIRHLLTHAAGFPEDNPWGDRQLADSPDEFIELLEAGISFSNVPGVAYEYSNLGFTLLGTIITNVSGQPYQQYIRENILEPLGCRIRSGNTPRCRRGNCSGVSSGQRRMAGRTVAPRRGLRGYGRTIDVPGRF